MRRRRARQAVCEQCGGTFAARLDTPGRFCSVLHARQWYSGRRHHQHNGGLSFDRKQSRWKIMCRDGTQMWYSRAVMEAELKRPLLPSELVHHRNEDPSDDRPGNLRLTTRVEHPTLHAAA